ncbi:hypothetical protein C0J52_17040 [Blattella germanica]|nr:hypothetical protein C0J52_17040 [Blattella germanica]
MARSTSWWCVYTIQDCMCNCLNSLMVVNFVSIVLAIREHFKDINKLLTNHNDKDKIRRMKITHLTTLFTEVHGKKDSSSYFTCRQALNIRLAYMKLFQVQRVVMSCYGVPILFQISCIFFSSVQTFYYAAYLFVETRILANFVSCQKTMDENFEILIRIEGLLLNSNVCIKTKQQLERFSSQLSKLKVDFSVCGLFSLNLPFLFSTLGIIFSYIILMCQII